MGHSKRNGSGLLDRLLVTGAVVLSSLIYSPNVYAGDSTAERRARQERAYRGAEGFNSFAQGLNALSNLGFFGNGNSGDQERESEERRSMENSKRERILERRLRDAEEAIKEVERTKERSGEKKYLYESEIELLRDLEGKNVWTDYDGDGIQSSRSEFEKIEYLLNGEKKMFFAYIREDFVGKEITFEIQGLDTPSKTNPYISKYPAFAFSAVNLRYTRPEEKNERNIFIWRVDGVPFKTFPITLVGENPLREKKENTYVEQ
jgi:hypothetical protein